MTQSIEAGAVFSKDRRYRYVLWRIWDDTRPYVSFIGLNPSTADEKHDDPTLRRCIGFARAWGWGGLYIINLFALTATYPKMLMTAKDPIGLDNNKWLSEIAGRAALVVASWGNHGKHLRRADEVTAMLKNLYHLQLTKQGQPAHPLYLSSKLTPKPF